MNTVGVRSLVKILSKNSEMQLPKSVGYRVLALVAALGIMIPFTLIVGFISGMYVANDSMLKSHDLGVTEYKLEYGHFRLKEKADDELLKAIEKGEQADIRTYYRDKAVKEATDEAVSEIEKALKDNGLEPEGITADIYKEN